MGECSSWIVVCEPCGGEGTIFKMYVQFNIPDFILIFVPNIWESYQIGLLSLGPVEPRGGKGTISKMCVQFKILDSILIFLPNIWGSYRVPARTLDPARTLVPCKTSDIMIFRTLLP